MKTRNFLLLPLLALLASPASAAPVSLLAKNGGGQPLEQVPFEVDGVQTKAWSCDEKAVALMFKATGEMPEPVNGALYVEVDYVDQGYGKLSVQFLGKDGKKIKPDRFLHLTRTDSGKIVRARMRIAGIQTEGSGDVAVRIGLERPQGEVLRIENVKVQETPFDDPQFAYVISDPWSAPWTGASVKPADNSTLKGKVMVGYQGWFRTPNDPEGRGWIHWGHVKDGTFTVDMWPDVSQYPPEALEKAADVKLKSGKQGALFSSAWPGAVDTHFRWMREHHIDGAFLQRFVSDNFNSIKGGPEWVLANVRAAANREGRIWAIEYDVSGYPDDRLLETLKTDWKWFVETFGILKDPCYAREGGKPVVFIWGLPFPNRNFTPETANAVVDFFKNDPKYGGNYVIGGIPGNWRKMEPAWQEHIKKYECVLPWMSQSYAEDIADFGNLGLSYYAHVKPGFSWANLKHLPTGDSTLAYTARDQGRYYWNLLAKAAQAGADRLFVGMFDEYDEATAIIPMSDDAPLTPIHPGVAATFYNGPRAQEQGEFVRLPGAEIPLGTMAPTKKTDPENFFVRMGGQILFPTAGDYTFFIEGCSGDDAELLVNGKKILNIKSLKETVTGASAVSVPAQGALPFRLDYRHGTGAGTLRLWWEGPGIERQPVDPAVLQDAWGRFVDNEGKPADWWLTLTRMGKEMINGTRKIEVTMPDSAKP